MQHQTPMSDHPAPVRVLKFGGTSVADAPRIRRVVELTLDEIAAAPDARFVVVVSALGGVTELLVRAARTAAAGGDGHEALLETIEGRHRSALEGALDPERQEEVGRCVEAWTEETRETLRGIALVRECTPRMLDRVLSLGERVSCALVAAAFRTAGAEAEAVDAREMLRTDD